MPLKSRLGDRWIERPQFPTIRRNSSEITPNDELCRGKIIWRVADQAWAVQQGLHISRCRHTECAILLPLLHNVHGWTIYPEDQLKIIAHIQRQVLACDKMYDKLFWFIQQQDEYHHPLAWDNIITIYDHKLRWYKLWYAERKNRCNQASSYYGDLIIREKDRIEKIRKSTWEARKAALDAKVQSMAHIKASDLAPNTIAFLERQKRMSELRDREERMAREERAQANQSEAWAMREHEQKLARKQANARYYQKRKLALKLARDRAKALGEQHALQTLPPGAVAWSRHQTP